MILRGFAVWVLIIGAETVHGIFRELLLAPAIGDFPARRVSSLTALLIIFGITWLTLRWIGSQKNSNLILLGSLWVVLTVIFEFFLGKLLLGYSWSRLLEDYDLSRGGLMGIGLLLMLFIPYFVFRLKGMENHDFRTA